ncbi:DUF2785 domain-containing protein [Bacillus cereus group sp. BceL310]|uniref:DUF2785 domain-containing protein n=1 Tax=Bacillus cereus group sp. BceL310 TaxID=3444975 RepID=UPI003EC4D052
MDITALQQQLELIQQNDYTQLQHIDINELTLNMLQFIGTTDSYVRYQLIYKCFAHFIHHEFLMDDQLKLLLQTCLSDEYLYCDIYSPHTDGVFTRSYTVSLLALILQFANSHYFFTVEDIEEIKNKLITYTNLETDFRGYIENKGWAHCLAHVSDAFTEIVHNSYTTFEWYEELIHCLLNKIFIPSDLFHNNEDERIVTPLLAMLYHDFPQDELISIIHKKIKRLPQIRKRLSLNEYCILCANIKTFLRTLFFRTKDDHNLAFTARKTERMLKELPNYY